MRRTLRAERRYEALDITGLTGITDAQRGTLFTLGAIEDHRNTTVLLMLGSAVFVHLLPEGSTCELPGNAPRLTRGFRGTSN